MTSRKYSIAVLFILLGSLSTAVRADRYWDANGAAAGAGGATPTGTWGIDNFWSASSAGTAATGAWTAGETAVFSAGTNATGTFDVNLDGTQNIAGIRFEEGTVTVTGGTELVMPGPSSADFNGNGVPDAADYVIWRTNNGAVGTGTQPTGDANGDTNVDITDYNLWRAGFGTVGGGTIEVAASSGIINSVISGTGSRLTKTGTGTLTLGGANTYSGGTTISAGKLSIPSALALGASPGAMDTDNIIISGGATLSNTSSGNPEFMVLPNQGITIGAGGGTIEVADAGADLGITALISGSDRWTKTGPGTLRLLNTANPFTGGFKVTAGKLVHSTFESATPAPGTLRASGAEPAAVVPDYVILDGGTIEYNNTGAGSTFLSNRKGITLTANGGGLSLVGQSSAGVPLPIGNSSISNYFAKVSAADGAILYKRGHGEIRPNKQATQTPAEQAEGWDHTKLVVEEGLYRVGNLGEEGLFGKVPAAYLADAIRLSGLGTTRETGAAAIGLTSGASHNLVTTTPSTRGITIDANGGTICTALGAGGIWNIESIITGPGALTINGNGFPVTATAGFETAISTLVFKGANTYGGGTTVSSGFLDVDGASATLGTGDVTVDGVSTLVTGLMADLVTPTTQPAAGKLRILAGVANAIANTATLNLTGGGTAGTADLGYIDLASGINETINKLMLTIAGTPTSVGPGVFGSTASGAANPGLAGLGANPDEYFTGLGTLTVLSAGSGSSLDGAGVPEPGAVALMLIGVMSLALRRRQ